MIGKIKGKITEIHGNEALIETKGGVSYRLFITPKIAEMVGDKPGKSTDIYTYLNVREDALTLFGFEDYETYRMFVYLVGVDGVGPKIAYTIISTTSANSIKEAVLQSDVMFFQKIKGIGKKTAQRILIDLSSTLGTEFDLDAVKDDEIDRDSIDALVSLGFKRKEAYDALKDIDPKLPIEDKIREALRSI